MADKKNFPSKTRSSRRRNWWDGSEMVDETLNGLVTSQSVGFTEKSDGGNFPDLIGLAGLAGLAGIVKTLAWIRCRSD